MIYGIFKERLLSQALCENLHKSDPTGKNALFVFTHTHTPYKFGLNVHLFSEFFFVGSLKDLIRLKIMASGDENILLTYAENLCVFGRLEYFVRTCFRFQLDKYCPKKKSHLQTSHQTLVFSLCWVGDTSSS